MTITPVNTPQFEFNKDIVNDYLNYIDVKTNSVKVYGYRLSKFIKFLENRKIKSPNRATVLNYKDWLFKQNLSAYTRHGLINTLRKFFSWTEEMGLYPNIAVGIRAVKIYSGVSKREGFTKDEVKQILTEIDTSSEIGSRDYAMLLLALTCGLRTIEINRANIGDIQNLKENKVLFIQGKGHEDKDLYRKIVPEVDTAIEQYLKIRLNVKSRLLKKKGETKKARLNKFEPLFVTSNKSRWCQKFDNGRMRTDVISRLIKNRFVSAGFDTKKYSAHSLRHTAITMLYKSTSDIYKAQKFARHTDANTTEIYIHSYDAANDHSEKDIFKQIFGDKYAELEVKKINKPKKKQPWASIRERFIGSLKTGKVD